MEAVKQTAESVQSTVLNLVGSASEAFKTQPPAEPQGWLKADQVEEIQPGEEEKAERIGGLIRKMQDHNFDQHQHKFRGTHVKSQAFVKGTITVHSDLPPHLRYGLFAHPGATYSCIARYASEPTFLKPDTERAPRGLGLKIFDVPGPRLNSEDALRTQDFLWNNAPMVELTDVDTTLEIMEIRERNFDNDIKLKAELALRSDRMKQFAPGMLPNNYMIGMDFFTQSSFAYGPYVAHFSLAPTNPAQQELKDKSIPSSASSTFHRESLRDYYASHPATYTFRAQFASDLGKHPVEDASTEWDEGTAPWHDLATIEFPAQETFSDARRVWWEDRIALSPWDGLADHKPLGSINRLRKTVYDMARGHRGRGNQVEVMFPRSAEEMPP